MLIALLIFGLLGIPIAACISVIGRTAGVPEDDVNMAALKALVFWPWPLIEGLARRFVRCHQDGE
jgi:hypothetical protein